MPATLTKPRRLFTAPMWKSPVSVLARIPAKVVMARFRGMEGMSFFAPSKTSSSPSRVVEVSSRASWGTELGPSRRLPSAVRATVIPLPLLEGQGKKNPFTRPSVALSKM